MFYDTVGDVQELTHGCTDYLHWCLAVLTQTLGKLFDDHVEPKGGDRREVQSFSDSVTADL